MLTKIYSAAVAGIDALMVTIEVVVEKGVTFTIVGLPDTAVRESYQRILSAIKQSDQQFPHRRIVVNLAPADVKKEGASFDLPMALGILASADETQTVDIEGTMVTGELSLDGSVLPVRGVLPMAIKARQAGCRRMIVPAANATEAAVVDGVEVFGVSNLNEALDIIYGRPSVQPTVVDTRAEFAKGMNSFPYDFSEVKGQESVRRAFEVACAGGHNLLLIGPPGAGKSMMAKRIPSILPPLSLAEALETTKIHSVAGKLSRGSMLMTARPFRSPHHTVSPVALVGGGANPQPGEISLAHNGVLFLDEFPEFPRSVLEVLRQPIEDRVVTVSRAKYTVDYPASFMLVASMNPCPCGYHGHPTRQCTCSPYERQRYRNRISGPLLDRIDLHVDIQPVAFDCMASTIPSEDSASIRARVIQARRIQQLRYSAHQGVYCNAQMGSRLIRQYAWPDAAGLAQLKQRMEKMNMSARAFDRILRVARTIADLDYAARITPSTPASASAPSGGMTLEQAVEAPIQRAHLTEAIAYRSLDRPDPTTTPFG